MEVTKEDLDKMIVAAVEAKTAAPKDQRISDIDFFWQIIPHILGGCITNTQLDTRPAMQKAFLVAREAVGQACMMGLCKPMTILSDGNQLSMMPSQMGASVPAPNQQPMMHPMGGGMAGMVPQQTMPGQGGMVAQYPMNAQNSPHIVGGGAAAGIPAGGMVAQYPMNMEAPMVYGQQGGPMGQPMQGGVRGVMTRQFPMDPAVAAAVAPLVNQGPAPGTPQYVAAQAAVPQYPHQQQPQAPQAPPGYAQPPQGYAVPQQPQYAPPQAPPGFAQPQAQPPVQYGPPPAVPPGFVPVAPPQGGFAPVVAPQGAPAQAVPMQPMGPRIG